MPTISSYFIHFAACSLTVIATISSASADCIDDAANYHGVDARVLRAIGWHESRLDPAAVGRNRNGSADLGAFQINSIHLPVLAQHGIDAKTLADGCVCAYVAAWYYRRQVDLHGDNWTAVGAYHSETPARRAWYANRIAALLMRWHATPAGALPFSPAQALAPSTPAALGLWARKREPIAPSRQLPPGGATDEAAPFSTLAFIPPVR
jgi:hypothetical protein